MNLTQTLIYRRTADFLGSLLCQVKPHKWLRSKSIGANVKQCARCGLRVPVKTRARVGA